MKTNAVLCRADIESPLVHTKFYISDSKMTAAVFWNFLENSENYTYAMNDEDAQRVLSSVDLKDVDYNQNFTSEQLNIVRKNSYWKLSDKRTIDLNTTLFSSSEVEGPVLFNLFLTHDGKIIGPFNKFVETFNRKSWTARDAEINRSTILFGAFSYKNLPKTFNDYRICFSYPQDTFFDCNITAQDTTSWSVQQRTDDYFSYFPKIKLTGNNTIQSNMTETLNIEFIDPETNSVLENYTANVYIQTTGGYVNKQRVTVTPDGANIVVRALDLEPGDTFKVKAGWRNYSGASEIKYTVG